MITTIEQGRYFHVTGTCKNQVNHAITTAVELAEAQAQAEGWMGVLVTRHDPITYTVALSPSVPYGTTFERDGY